MISYPQIVAIIKFLITYHHSMFSLFQHYLKGLSVVPSSEGFTITALRPAYLKNGFSLVNESPC